MTPLEIWPAAAVEPSCYSSSPLHVGNGESCCCYSLRNKMANNGRARRAASLMRKGKRRPAAPEQNCPVPTEQMQRFWAPNQK